MPQIDRKNQLIARYGPLGGSKTPNQTFGGGFDILKCDTSFNSGFYRDAVCKPLKCNGLRALNKFSKNPRKFGFCH